MQKVKYVGVAAYSGTPSEEVKQKAQMLMKSIKKFCRYNVVIVVGGYEGLMKVIVDEAISSGFTTVILPPVEQEHWKFPDEAIVIKTGATYIMRSSILVHTSDALVVVGGGAGSLQELMTAYNERKPVYVLTGTGLPTDAVSVLPDRVDPRISISIKCFEDPILLAENLCNSL